MVEKVKTANFSEVAKHHLHNAIRLVEKSLDASGFNATVSMELFQSIGRVTFDHGDGEGVSTVVIRPIDDESLMVGGVVVARDIDAIAAALASAAMRR